ncbi:MAG: O-antigen ligase family protein [Pseudomonadota bacterium]
MRNDTWLDHLSTRESREAVANDQLLDGAAVWLGRIVLTLTLIYLMLGFGPARAESAAGSAAGGLERQVAFLSLAALASPLLLMRWERALLVLSRMWSLLLVYAVLIGSVFWSEYPGITVRRFFVYFILLIVAVAVASVLKRPRDYFPPLIAAFAFVLFANFAYTALNPADAWSELGLRAIHTSKNAAGMVAQAMAIVFACALIALRGPAAFWGTAFLLLATFAFLVLTLSKTALGLTALSVAVFIPAFLLAWQSRIGAALTLVGVVAVVGAVFFATGTLNLTAPDWAEIITGDPTFSARDELWQAAMLHIEKEPWLGYGFGAQWSLLPLYHPLWNYVGFWKGIERAYLILGQFHNGYLDLFVHGGVVLFGAAGLFIVHQFRRIGAMFGGRTDDRWAAAGAALFTIYFITLLFSNMMESSLFFPDMFLGQFVVILVAAQVSWQLPRTI